MSKVSLSNKFIALLFGLIFASLTSSLFAKDVAWSALIKIGEDKPGKIPLILIHGINGTKPCEERAKEKEYWGKFKEMFRQGTDLQEKYSLYLFQYCSGQTEVSKIALELRDLIDENLNLRDRNHVILAHSMGGLVAKSYMAETVHLQGKWKGRTGGATTIGIITLATLHHGTPGANSPQTLDRYFASALLREGFERANEKYWKGSAGENHPSVSDSSVANRSDLRWDNYDGKWKTFGKDWDSVKNDINKALSDRNFLFQHYNSKLIAYAGYLDSEFHPKKTIEFIDELKKQGKDETIKENPHRLLTIANFFLVYGLDKNFGFTDGLVPFKSALFCDSEETISATNKTLLSKSNNYICKSPSRVRRFEPGTEGLIPKYEYPDVNTLSIWKKERGFDHLDMLENEIVLSYVRRDLRDLANSSSPITNPIPLPNPLPIPAIPTLFLFDVSGSMNENGKIGQARDAGLDALREMREGGGGNSSPVSIMTFSGDSCGANSTQKLSDFSGNLTEAETVMRSRLPAPNGGTPLPQAKDAAWAEMERFLNSNPNAREGRIVLLSDGQSTCGAIRPPGVFSRDITTVSRSDSKIKFFTIGLDVPAGSIAERDLQYLASETGGKYFAASDRRQLIRAFQKQVRRFAPRPCSAANADFSGGLRAFADSDYRLALESFRRYAAGNPNDSCGVYNLALAFEANDRYKTAGEYYRQYLNLAPASPDRAKIEQKIVQLNQDYADQFEYFINLIQSDADYLRRYWDSVFNRSSSDLAQEYNGFVYEKSNFYKTLPEILEVNERWLINDAKDISSSIDTLSRRTRLKTFDSDAVSLLTTPIGEIRDLLERMRNYQANNFR